MKEQRNLCDDVVRLNPKIETEVLKGKTQVYKEDDPDSKIYDLDILSANGEEMSRV